jgi:hypothetical protein
MVASSDSDRAVERRWLCLSADAIGLGRSMLHCHKSIYFRYGLPWPWPFAFAIAIILRELYDSRESESESTEHESCGIVDAMHGVRFS